MLQFSCWIFRLHVIFGFSGGTVFPIEFDDAASMPHATKRQAQSIANTKQMSVVPGRVEKV